MRRRDAVRGEARRAARPSRRSGATTRAVETDEVAVARRSAAPDLHLLPPGAGRRGAGRADAAHAVRPRDRGDRARVPGAGARRWRSGWCARRRRSARRGIPYACPSAEELPRAARRGDGGRLPGLQRGLRGERGRRAGPARAVRGGDPPRAPAASSCCRARPRRAALLALMLLHDARRDARVDAARRRRAARGAGSRALGSRADRRGAGAGRGGAARGGRRARTRCRRRSPALHARAARAADTDWRADRRRSTRVLARACTRRRWSRSTTPSRSRWPTGRRRGCALHRRARRRRRLAGYHLLPAARADLLRRLGRLSKRPPPTARRWRWSATRPSGASSSAGWPSSRRRETSRSARSARVRLLLDGLLAALARSARARLPLDAFLVALARAARKDNDTRRKSSYGTAARRRVPAGEEAVPMQPHDSSRSRFPRPHPQSPPPEVAVDGATPGPGGLEPPLPFAQSRVVVAAPALLIEARFRDVPLAAACCAPTRRARSRSARRAAPTRP